MPDAWARSQGDTPSKRNVIGAMAADHKLIRNPKQRNGKVEEKIRALREEEKIRAIRESDPAAEREVIRRKVVAWARARGTIKALASPNTVREDFNVRIADVG
jgi:hypothetical protein